MSNTQERRYHEISSSSYSLPNDPTEHQRLELQSAAIDEMMHGECHLAPLQKPSKILEVGSGTGAVTRQLAAMYPSAQVISNDLSPMPNQDKLPKNVTFLQGDFRNLAGDQAVLPPGSFDYIFSRMLVYGMPDWPGYIAEAKSLLAPGGYLELQELDTLNFWGMNQDAFPLPNYIQEMAEVFAGRALDIAIAPKLAGYMRDAGFLDVEVKEFRWAFGDWAGHPETSNISAYSTKYLGEANFGAYKKLLGPKRTVEQLEAVHREMLQNCSPESGKHKRFWVVVGRKA